MAGELPCQSNVALYSDIYVYVGSQLNLEAFKCHVSSINGNILVNNLNFTYRLHRLPLKKSKIKSL